MRFAFLLLALAASLPAQIRSIVIDTDVGSDDLMAISYLLANPKIQIEASPIANGLAYVDAGGRNILRLLELAGRKEVKVYLGRPNPLQATAEFPAEWRTTSDALPGVKLPQTSRRPEAESASDFYVRRLKDTGKPITILALGPLTNLAEKATGVLKNAQEIVIMGGALRVRGNLDDGG